MSGLVGFRAAVGSNVTSPLVSWYSPQSSQIAYGRGTKGFVVINNADSDWTGTFTTELGEGSYCDVVSGSVSDGVCTGAG